MARIGIFGGSFDPVHFGHLILADTCLEAGRLDHVVFMPAAQSPHKSGGPQASDRQRVDMLRLAISGNDHFSLSTRELDRGGISYTIDTLDDLLQNPPDEVVTAAANGNPATPPESIHWIWMMGMDSFSGFAKWKDPAGICSRVEILVVRRPDSPAIDWLELEQVLDAATVRRLQDATIDCPLIEISSSDLRRRRQLGQSIRYRLPSAVQAVIEDQGLYAAKQGQEI